MQRTEILKELELAEEQYWEDSAAAVEHLRRQYPDGAYKKIVLEILEEQQLQWGKQIEKKRNEYNAIKTFKDRQTYYNEHLSIRELGYRTAKEKAAQFLQSPTPKPYESWVTPEVVEYMKINGYRNTIRHYMDMGFIL